MDIAKRSMIQLYFDNFRGWALPWICHCCEFNQSYQWDPSCILCLTCYLPVLKSQIYFKYSILFPMRQVRIDSLYCICHKHQCAFFLPQSPVIHVAYRVRCKGGHLRIKLSKRSPWFWHAGWIMCIFYIQFVINTNLWSKIQRCCNIC